MDFAFPSAMHKSICQSEKLTGRGLGLLLLFAPLALGAACGNSTGKKTSTLASDASPGVPTNGHEDSEGRIPEAQDGGSGTRLAADAYAPVNTDYGDGGSGISPATDARAGASVDTGAKVCPPQRVVGLDSSTEVSYAELPETIKGFLTSFLSADYIKEHFRFFTRSDSSPPEKTVLYIHMTYGAQTVGGTITWGTAYGDKIVYAGPSKAWEVLVDHAAAAAQAEAAGCGMSNYCVDLRFELEQNGPTETDQYGNRGSHLVWTTGGTSATCSPVTGAVCECTSNRCVVNAQTGALSFQEGTRRCLASGS